MTDSLQKYLAELLGTFTLVFVGTMGILAARGEVARRNVAIAFAFGLALLAGLYAFADVSGGHFNPGVSLAMFLDKRLDLPHMIGYWLAQLAGAVLGSLCVLIAFDQDAVASTATAARPAGRGNRALPRVARDRDLRARHPQLVGPRTARWDGSRRHPADARGRAPGADPVQRLVAQHGAELRAGSDRLRVDGLLGLHRRPDRWRDHRVARVRDHRRGRKAGRGRRRHHHRLRRPTSGRPARGSSRSARPGGARRGSRPRRAPPGSGTGGQRRR